MKTYHCFYTIKGVEMKKPFSKIIEASSLKEAIGKFKTWLGVQRGPGLIYHSVKEIQSPKGGERI